MVVLVCLMMTVKSGHIINKKYTSVTKDCGSFECIV